MISIGTPYKENSVLALARQAATESSLERFFTTLYTAKALAFTQYLPRRFRESLERELKRREYSGIPRERVASVAVAEDVALFAIRRLGPASFASAYVLKSKDRFDQQMASAIPASASRAVIGMWGSCAQTLGTAQKYGRLSVMNYVNSHPDVHNALVHDVGRAPKGHHELLPQHLVERVNRETDRADVVLVPSNFVAQQLRDRGIGDERIIVEPYGVDLRSFTPPIRPRTASARLRCLFVGQVGYRKGVPFLMETARRAAHFADFRLIGPPLESALLADLPDNVTYSGVLVQSEVAQAMRDADVLILPSVEDSFALVVLEAMATALPVIVSDHIGVSELLEHDENALLFPVADVDALYRLVEELHADPERRTRLGEAGHRFVQSSASWTSYATKVLGRLRERMN